MTPCCRSSRSSACTETCCRRCRTSLSIHPTHCTGRYSCRYSRRCSRCQPGGGWASTCCRPWCSQGYTPRGRGTGSSCRYTGRSPCMRPRSSRRSRRHTRCPQGRKRAGNCCHLWCSRSCSPPARLSRFASSGPPSRLALAVTPSARGRSRQPSTLLATTPSSGRRCYGLWW